MSVSPGMIYNRHRPALIKHCEARMLFGLYQQDGSSSRLERYDESGLDNLKEWWVRSMIPASPCIICPARRDRSVGCKRFMVMK